MLTRHAEVYSSFYRIHAKFSGLRYFMFYFPITAAMTGTFFNMFLLSTIFIMSWYRFFIPPESMIDTTYYGGHDNLDAKKETNNLGEEKIEKIDEDYEHLASTIKDD